MSKFLNLLFVSLLMLILLTSLLPFAEADPGDITHVLTFDHDFYNWADPHVQTFQFPDSSLEFSQITLYYTIGCPPGDCDPWDRLGYLRVVNDDSTTTEIARIITPYDITPGPGECTWELDVTDYQSILRDDVTLSNFISTWIGDERGWEVTILFEFIEGELEATPYKVVNLWQRYYAVYGDPDRPIEDHLQSVTVDIDAEAISAKVRVITTGHGQGNTNNAAEFSYKWHAIVANNEEFSHYLWRDDCEYNTCSPQSGTWPYDRAGWCPGDKVTPWDVDISEVITPGEPAVLDYNIEPYENFCRPTNPDCINGVTCTDCEYNYTGHTEPNYAIQAQLILYALPSRGLFRGTVSDGTNPLEFVQITATREDVATYSTFTDGNGNYEILVGAGTYTLSACLFGYGEAVSESYTIEAEQEIDIDFELSLLATGNLTGYLRETYFEGLPPIVNAPVTIVDAPLSAAVSDIDGQYSFTDLPVGDYMIQANSSYHVPSEAEVTIFEDETAVQDFYLIPAYSFEDDNEGWTASGSANWQWGQPNYEQGPANAYHGLNCWGTDLNGNYGNVRNGYLYTAIYQLDPSAAPFELVLHLWYDTEEGQDGSYVQISAEEESFNRIDPIEGYPSSSVVSLTGQPGYSGLSDGWIESRFDLSAYADSEVQFRIRFGSDAANNGAGVYLDYAIVYGQTNYTVGVDNPKFKTAAPIKFTLLQNYPNPFNPKATIRFELPQATQVSLQIYDVSGRLIRTLLNESKEAGYHSLIWDGTDEHGQTMSSGLYFYRIDTEGFSDTKSMILLK